MVRKANAGLSFDAWTVSRSGALARFAYLVTGDARRAADVLESALISACVSWSRVSRSDDPEAQVRKLIVVAQLSWWRRIRRGESDEPKPGLGPARIRVETDAELDPVWRVCGALSPAGRAAVVLRFFEGLGYAQIAAVLGCSESTARKEVHNGLDVLRAELTLEPPPTDEELEEPFRRRLAEHAEEVIDEGGWAAVVVAEAGRRRRRRAKVVASCIAVALVPAAVVVALSRGGTEQPGAHPGGWRAEAYNGIQLWVPPSWGWNGVPHPSANGPIQCGAGAFPETTSSGDMRYHVNGDATTAYVGRPIPLGAGCQNAAAFGSTHVWFDSPLSPGSSGDQTTVRVNGAAGFTITVADADADERKTILGSIQPITTDANGCPTTAQRASWRRASFDPGSVTSVSVCLYYTHAVPPSYLLPNDDPYPFYSTRLRSDLAAVVTSILAGTGGRGTLPVDACPATGRLWGVDLIAHAGDRNLSSLVVPDTCPGQRLARVGSGAGANLLSRRAVRLWAVDGVALYTTGSRLAPFAPGT